MIETGVQGCSRGGLDFSAEFFNGDYVIALMCIIEDILTFQRLYGLGREISILLLLFVSACQYDAMTY